jgi:hypothetical protein
MLLREIEEKPTANSPAKTLSYREMPTKIAIGLQAHVGGAKSQIHRVFKQKSLRDCHTKSL